MGSGFLTFHRIPGAKIGILHDSGAMVSDPGMILTRVHDSGAIGSDPGMILSHLAEDTVLRPLKAVQNGQNQLESLYKSESQ